MIVKTLELLQNTATVINFACYITIFLGGFYIAVHSRVIPRWLSTCIWYTGLSAMLSAMTIMIELIWGSQHDLSFANIGILSNTLLHLMLSVTVGILFAQTVSRDLEGRRKRHEKNPDTLL